MSPIVSPDTSKLAWFAHITPNGTAPDQTVQQVRIYSGNLTSYIGNSNSAGVSIFQTNPGGYLDDAKSIAFSPDGSNLVVSACMSGWYDSGKRRDLYVIDLQTGSRSSGKNWHVCSLVKRDKIVSWVSIVIEVEIISAACIVTVDCECIACATFETVKSHSVVGRNGISTVAKLAFLSCECYHNTVRIKRSFHRVVEDA